MRSLFCAVISGSCEPVADPARSAATQITPLVCLIMKAISSGVALLAAKMMSPSFSRLASSTTTTGRPAAISATALSTVSSGTGSATGPWSPAATPAGRGRLR